MAREKPIPMTGRGCSCVLTTRVLISMALLLVGGFLAGCKSVHLYDPARAAVSKSAVEQKNNVKLNTVSEKSAETLDALLVNEIAVSNSAHDFLFRNDLFRMAASEGRSETVLDWIDAVDLRLKGLGYDSREQFAQELELRPPFEILRSDVAAKRLEFELMSPEWAKKLPGCRKSMPDEWVDVSEAVAKAVAAVESGTSTLDADVHLFYSAIYPEYRDLCDAFLTVQEKLKPFAPTDGAIAATRAAMEERRDEIARREKSAKDAAAAIKDLKSKIKDATKSGVKPSETLARELADLRAKVGSLKATQSAFDIEVLSEETIDSIEAVLVGLAAAPEGDEMTLSPELETAAQMLKNVTSLADSAAALSEKSKQPPVAHLVIEMNRQILLHDFARRMIALEKAEIEYLEEMLKAYLAQAASYREFGLALCNFGYDDFPKTCDQLAVDLDADDAEKCAVPGEDAPCPLKKTWAELLETRGEKKRHVLEAVVALADSHRAAKRASEFEYRINDNTYRRTLLASEIAIAQWKNLIDIPVDQVAAFYDAGVKPETIGDFLVKALIAAGLIAVAATN